MKASCRCRLRLAPPRRAAPDFLKATKRLRETLALSADGVRECLRETKKWCFNAVLSVKHGGATMKTGHLMILMGIIIGIREHV